MCARVNISFFLPLFRQFVGRKIGEVFYISEVFVPGFFRYFEMAVDGACGGAILEHCLNLVGDCNSFYYTNEINKRKNYHPNKSTSF